MSSSKTGNPTQLNNPRRTSGNKEYGTYLAKYMGVGLIGGSVVHIGTLGGNVTWYILLALAGMLLMVLGNLYEAKLSGQKINIKYFALIFCLSLATGFLTGGIQHYVDNPGYAGGLLATGIFVSYVTYFLKEGLSLRIKNIVTAIIIATTFLLISNIFVKDIVSELHAKLEDPNAPAHTH